MERELHFVNDIEPVLTKTGCNTGGCHGKASGQNGFKLSLFAFEPKFDYDALVNEAHGRRVFPASPEESLLLKKATGAIVHGGGSRFDEKSEAYKLLCRWIAQGVPYGAEDAPKVKSIEVQPRERLLAGVGEQQLRVIAHYTDGAAHDVTRQAEYKAQQPDILKVEPNGLVSTLGHTGEGAVMVRYMGQVDVARVAVPFSRGLPEASYAHFIPKSYVDEMIETKWKKLGIAPSPDLLRRRIHPPRQPRRDRHAANARGDQGLPGRLRDGQARSAGRSSARAAGIREFLGEPMGRSAARETRRQ